MVGELVPYVLILTESEYQDFTLYNSFLYEISDIFPYIQLEVSFLKNYANSN